MIMQKTVHEHNVMIRHYVHAVHALHTLLAVLTKTAVYLLVN